MIDIADWLAAERCEHVSLVTSDRRVARAIASRDVHASLYDASRLAVHF